MAARLAHPEWRFWRPGLGRWVTPPPSRQLRLITSGPLARHCRIAILRCHQRTKQSRLVDRLNAEVRQVAPRHHDPCVPATACSSMMPDNHHGIPTVAPLRRQHPNLGPAREVLETTSYVHATLAMRRHIGDVRHDAEPERCVTCSIVSVGIGHASMIGDRTWRTTEPVPRHPLIGIFVPASSRRNECRLHDDRNRGSFGRGAPSVVPGPIRVPLAVAVSSAVVPTRCSRLGHLQSPRERGARHSRSRPRDCRRPSMGIRPVNWLRR